jgi:hypothetical protein
MFLAGGNYDAYTNPQSSFGMGRQPQPQKSPRILSQLKQQNQVPDSYYEGTGFQDRMSRAGQLFDQMDMLPAPPSLGGQRPNPYSAPQIPQMGGGYGGGQGMQQFMQFMQTMMQMFQQLQGGGMGGGFQGQMRRPQTYGRSPYGGY